MFLQASKTAAAKRLVEALLAELLLLASNAAAQPLLNR
jgi:hypothetical protein